MKKWTKIEDEYKIDDVIIYRMHFLRFGVDFSVRRRFLVDFGRFRAFFTRLKTDPFGWAPPSERCKLAASILLHADRNRFGFHFFVDFGLSLAADRLRNIAEDVKAFTLEIVFDVTQRAQRGTSQGTAVVESVGGSSRSHP
jgi:hypothetical protein